MVMDILFFSNVFQLGLKALRTAYGKVFEDILTNSLKDLSVVSLEYEPLANCLLEIIKTGSIKIERLPDKDEDYLNEMASKIKSSDHFGTYCDSDVYTDAKLKQGLSNFFHIFENNLTKNQKLFNRLQLEYDRKLLQTTRKTEKNTEDIKSDISALRPKVDQILDAVSSKDNLKVNTQVHPGDYKSKYLETLFGLAFELLSNREFKKALRKYKEFIKEKNSASHRKYFAVLNNIAVAYLGLGNHKKVLEYADRAHRIAPKKYQPILNLAVAYFHLHKLNVALEYAEKASKKRINDPNVYNTLSIIHAEKGDRGKAYQFVNKAIKKEKKFAPAYVNRAILHTQSQKYEDALNDLSKAIEFDPQNGEFFVHVGVVLEKKLFSMIQSEVVSLGTKGDIHYVNYERSDNLTSEESELLEKAIDNYEKALKLGVKIKDNPTLGVNLANCYLMKKKYKETEKIYKQIRVKNERGYPYQSLGDMYF